MSVSSSSLDVSTKRTTSSSVGATSRCETKSISSRPMQHLIVAYRIFEQQPEHIGLQILDSEHSLYKAFLKTVMAPVMSE